MNEIYLHFNRAMHEIDIWHTAFIYIRKILHTSRTSNNTNLWWMFCTFQIKCQQTIERQNEGNKKKKTPSIYLSTARINVKQIVSLSNWSSVCLFFFITVERLTRSTALIWTIHSNIYIYIEFHIKIALRIDAQKSHLFIYLYFVGVITILPWIYLLARITPGSRSNFCSNEILTQTNTRPIHKFD